MRCYDQILEHGYNVIYEDKHILDFMKCYVTSFVRRRDLCNDTTN